MAAGLHLTVLLQEAVQALAIRADGRYVDATFGRGGHSAAILAQLGPAGALLALDRDPEAVAHGRERFADDRRLVLHQAPFSVLAAELAGLGWQGVDGVLMDLGVSSPQLDDAQRGFSFLRDGPLDMRMDPDQGESAASWVNRVAEMELVRVFRDYGEERFAKRIAAAIVAERRLARFETTGRLAEVIAKAHPAWEKGKHPATRCFQAIRIHINGELDELQKGLDAALGVLKPGGRLAVISFHSLEDRMVKRFIRDQAKGRALPPGLPVMDAALGRTLRPVGGSIRPGACEVAENPRARSAVLRIAEKI